MAKNYLGKIVITILAAVQLVAVGWYIHHDLAQAYVRYGPAAQLNAGDIKSSHILDGTIVGADISGSASTTMNKFLTGELYATSSVSLPSNSITDAMLIDTITATNYLSLSSWFGTTTDILDEGTSNLYYTNARVQSFVHASGTIPKTYTDNTFTGTGLFTASTTFSATTTITASSATNGALVLNGISYKFPPTQSASSTVLATDGAGSLSWHTIQNNFMSGSTSTEPGITGSQQYTHGLGRVPNLIRLELYTTTTTGSDVVDVQIVGQATSTAFQICNYKAINLTANTAVNRYCDGVADILRVDSPGGGGVNTRIQVQLTGLTSTTFTLNWSDNDSGGNNSTRFIVWTLF